MTRRPTLSRSAFWYLVPLAGVLALAALAMMSGWILLARAGEFTPAAEIAALQAGDTSLVYGVALRDNRRRYKWELHRVRPAEIAVLGSSRSQNFRQDGFRVSFANLGGGILTIDEGPSFVNGLAEPLPGTVILTLDPWWFDSRRPGQSPRRAFDRQPEDRVAAVDLLLPARWLAAGKLDPGQAWRLLSQRPQPRERAGLIALLKGDGFRADGSYAYEGTAMAARPQPAPLETAPVAGNESVFSATGFAALRHTVNTLRQRGVRVVLTMPPVSPAQYREYMADPALVAALAEAWRQVRTLGVPAFDFLDPASLGAGPCEFIDSIHPGEITGLRLLLRLAQADPADVGRMVDVTAAQSAIATLQGHVILWKDGGENRETDFLGMGCRKGSRPPRKDPADG